MKDIILTKGKVAMVDECDAHLASLKWCFNGRYPVRTFSEDKGGHIFLHHAIMGRPLNGLQIDHIDGNTLNNSRSNLRIVTRRQNAQNQTWHRDGSKQSKHVGVKIHRSTIKGKVYEYWLARISLNGTRKTLGYFKNEHDAAEAYNTAAKGEQYALAISA